MYCVLRVVDVACLCPRDVRALPSIILVKMCDIFIVLFVIKIV